MAKVRKSTLEDIAPRVEFSDNKKFRIENYDVDNLYPQRVEDIQNDSGTAKACLRLYAKFVLGQGANNEEFGKLVINKDGLTVNKLIRLISFSKGRFNGVGIHVNYNGLGQIIEANFVKFPYIRKGIRVSDKEDYSGKWAIYDNWDGKKHKNLDPEKVDYIDEFNPSLVLRQVEAIEIKDADKYDEQELLKLKWSKYKGQLLYFISDEFDTYPLSPVDACLEDCQTEAQTKRFKFGSSARNFLASHMVITPPEEQELDDEGSPIEDDSEGIGQTLSEFQGGDGTGGIIHIESENPEEDVVIKKLEIQNYDGLYEYTEESVTLDIIRQYNQPSIFHVQTPGKLASSSEIADAKEYYNEITQPDRDEISDLLEMIFSRWREPINNEGDYSIRPLNVLKPIPKEWSEHFTTDEIRASLGYAPKEKENNIQAR